MMDEDEPKAGRDDGGGVVCFECGGPPAAHRAGCDTQEVERRVRAELRRLEPPLPPLSDAGGPPPGVRRFRADGVEAFPAKFGESIWEYLARAAKKP